MRLFQRASRQPQTPDPAADRVRAKYASFRDLLALNNESLELMAGLQDDLQYVAPRREVLGGRIGAIFDKIGGVVASLERLTGLSQRMLAAAVETQRSEVERYASGLAERAAPPLSVPLGEIDADAENIAGSKAAVLGEIRKLGLPVPDGFVLTAKAYWQSCGLPLWEEIRDATHDPDLNDPDALRRVSEALTRRVMECPLPAAIEAAIADGADALLTPGDTLAVRSSARGEGNARSYAGQFLSLLNVPADQAVDAYRRVIAAKFSERALFYRLSAGLREVDTPMAALFLKMIPARAAGIMYTRDPSDPKSKHLWITATRGLGVGIASGRNPADLFLVTRSGPHTVVERHLVKKEEEIVLREGGGIATVPLTGAAQEQASLPDNYLRTLADWGVHLERHFRTPQDIEWVLDLDGALRVVQSRPLANAEAGRAKARPLPKTEPKLAGGRTVYPGRTSGKAFLVDEIQNIGGAPAGAVVFIRKPSPEIVGVLPRIAGLVAEWGNIAGHAATLLREFQIPSVFQMTGAFDRLTNDEPVSLDAVQARVYAGILWPPPRKESSNFERYRHRAADPIAARLLTLNLLDPAADNFRPSGCQSGHDVLRYCHEKAIATMFEINDREVESGGAPSFKLETSLPLHLSVIDLGGGLAQSDPGKRSVTPAQIVSRPFQALWQGISHPEVTWTRHMPASISDVASILSATFMPRGGIGRPLGQDSHLLVADEYMNLNSRLAYHYSLVDACVSDSPAENYISFRFEGGGAPHGRRSLRACFLEKCLVHYGFGVDRRGDLVNAWFRKAPADQTADRLDLLGRLLACSSQLDMYMQNQEVMNWFAGQFILGNYGFRQQS